MEVGNKDMMEELTGEVVGSVWPGSGGVEVEFEFGIEEVERESMEV